jgi:hypothetical protein
MKSLHQVLSEKSLWYKVWHERSGHHALHWAVFLLFVVATAAVLTTQASEVGKGADLMSAVGSTQENARDLTNDVLRSARDFSLSSPNERSSKLTKLVATAKQREVLMAHDLKANPQNFLLNSVPEAVYAKLPPEVQAHVEKHTELAGTISSSHPDTVDGVSTAEEYYLSNNAKNDSKPTRLYLAQGHLPVGAKVKVKGVVLGTSMVLADSGGETVQETTSYVPPPLYKEHKALVVLVNFKDNKTQPFTPDEIKGTLYSNPNSVANFYTEQSYGKIHFTFEVTNWLTLNTTSTSCEFFDWRTLGKAAAKAAGKDPDQYNHVVFFFPRNGTCPFAGRSTIPGSDSWINGGNYVQIFSHELGHNLGLHHASTLPCKTKAIDVPSQCTENQYGDHTDTMGGASFARHFNAVHKVQAQFMTSANVRTVSTPGKYTIHKNEVLSSTTQALRIFKKDTNEYYYVDYRQSVGFDASPRPLPIGITSGAEIVVWDESAGTKTKKIDTTPPLTDTEESNFDDASLSDGKNFTDPINGIVITQISHTPDTVTVYVNVGGTTSCVKNSPTLTVKPISAAGVPGQKLSYALTVTNKNSPACLPSVYLVGAVLSPVGFTKTAATRNLSIVSGGKGSYTFEATSPTTAVDGIYEFTMGAGDIANATPAVTAKLSYVVSSPAIADTTKPSVSITAPGSSSSVPKNTALTFAAQASDAVGVTKVEFYTDTALLCADQTAPYSCVWNVPNLSKIYVIRARAYDAAGNTGLSPQILVNAI